MPRTQKSICTIRDSFFSDKLHQEKSMIVADRAGIEEEKKSDNDETLENQEDGA